MAKTQKQKPVLTFDEKEYDIESMTDKQKTIVNHLHDLQNKMNNMHFNLNQLEVGNEAFSNMLRESFKSTDVEEIEVEV